MNKIPENVLKIISTAELNNGVLKLTCGQLDRKVYVAVNKILESLGGKWNRKRGGHVFENDPTDDLEQILLTGEYVDKKKEFQMFFTPPDLVEKLIELAGIEDGQLCLEPSAGTGNILRKLPEGSHFCEIQGSNLIAPTIHWNDIYKMVGLDFLQYQPGPIYDRVVANPPFTKQQDIDHVLHMIECCKNGGRVVSIMSNGVKFRENKKTKEFRSLLSFIDHTFIDLDPGAFKNSGTMVNAIIAVIDKG